MKKEINPANLKLDSNAKKQIHKCLDLVKEIFGQDLLGLYLYGSAIIGGLQKYSDIDLFLVTNRATTREEKTQFATAFKTMLERKETNVKGKDRLQIDQFSFEQVLIKYQKLILSWLQQPHVSEWFCGQGLENTIQELNKFLHSSSIFQYWLAFDQQHPFALLMTSSVDKPSDELTRWCSDTGETITLDILIGDSNYLGKGIAHHLIQRFLVSRFPRVKEVLIDPDATNLRAIHVYKKAGFQIIGEFIPSHSDQLHTMMRLDMRELVGSGKNLRNEDIHG